MACPCDSGVNIRTCGPFANRDDVMEIIAMTCKECVASVPLGTDPVDFCTLGFGGAMDDCCDLLFVMEGTENIWYSTDCTNWVLPGCNTCFYEIDPVTYPDKTTWCAVADAAGLSTDCCTPMWFYDGTDMWLTDDCVTFQNMTTRTPNVIDIEANTQFIAGAVLAFDGNWYNWPGGPSLLITLDEDGYIMAEASLGVNSDSLLVQGRIVLNSVTPFAKSGSKVQNAASSLNVNIFAATTLLTAGTYNVSLQYNVSASGATNATERGSGLRAWTLYED